MANIKANGTAIIGCGEEVIRLTNSYKTEINKLFDLLSKLNNTAWFGPAADSYVRNLSSNKSQFVNFADNLEIYGKVIRNTGENINRIIDKWEAK